MFTKCNFTHRDTHTLDRSQECLLPGRHHLPAHGAVLHPETAGPAQQVTTVQPRVFGAIVADGAGGGVRSALCPRRLHPPLHHQLPQPVSRTPHPACNCFQLGIRQAPAGKHISESVDCWLRGKAALGTGQGAHMPTCMHLHLPQSPAIEL